MCWKRWARRTAARLQSVSEAWQRREGLRFHQEHSGPVMQELHRWLEAPLAERPTEPNSGLGKAITYLLRHRHGLTAFLRELQAPLDNNLCERALKRAVLNRKNALFYRTLNGAQVGDLYMSLIHTCQQCGANSFDDLSEVQRHAEELASQPVEWMPWNYRETLQRTAAGRASGRRSFLRYDESCLARNHRLGPGRCTPSKWAKSAHWRDQNRARFLATPSDEAKRCFARVFTHACPHTASRSSLADARDARLCGGAGWSMVMQVKEIGSGASQREKREKLLEAARRREIDVVLVWRLDRWGRSVTDLLATLQELEHLGVGFVSLTEALDLTTPVGRAMSALLAVFAQFEREILRKRVRADLAHARQNGQRLGRPLTAALQADRVPKLYRAGISKSEIAGRLNIGRTSVRRMLTSRIEVIEDFQFN